MVDTPPQMNLDDAATPWGRWATNTIKELLAAQDRTQSAVQNNNTASAGVATVAAGATVAAAVAQVAAEAPITDARIDASNPLTIWPFIDALVPKGAIAPGAVSSTEIADFAITALKYNDTRHHIF